MQCNIESIRFEFVINTEKLPLPWIDGTECGSNHQCLQGKCVPNKTQTPVDGGWSAWER